MGRAAKGTLCAVGLAVPAAAAVHLDVIAVTGEPAPLLPPDHVLFSVPWSDAIQNQQGEIAFMGVWTTGATWGESMWGPAPGGSLAVLLEEGDAAPGLPAGTVFSGFTPFFLNDAGQIFFAGYLSGPGVTSSNDLAFWRSDGAGGYELLLREGDVAPGPGPAGVVTDSQVAARGFSNQGHVLLQLRVDDGTQERDTLLRFPPSGPGERLIWSGDPVPGAPGAELLYPGLGGTLADDGRVFTWGRLVIGPGGVDASNEAVLLEFAPDGAVSLVARAGDPAAAIPGTHFAALVRSAQGNAAGKTAYAGRLQDGVGGVTTDDDMVTVVRAPGGATQVIREGMLAPDIAGDVPLAQLLVSAIAPSGHVAYRGYLPTAHPDISWWNDEVVYVAAPGGALELVAREPGARNVYVNSFGDVAMTLYDGGAQDPIEGVAFVPSGGSWTSPLRLGDEIEVAPGDLREVSSIYSFVWTAEQARLNDLRQMLFFVGFTDGEKAILRLTLTGQPAAAVPAPGRGAALVIAAGVLLAAGAPLRRARALRRLRG